MSAGQSKNTGQSKNSGKRKGPTKKGSGGRKRGGGGGASRVDPAEFWKPVPQLGDPEPISVTTDPTMVVRSLGDLPLYGHGQHVAHEINRVLVRSAMLAGALADVAGLSSEPDAEAPD